MAGKGFSGIYSNDENTIKEAQQALRLKREILLANPELDMDKLIVGRYRIGTSARQINPRSLGTQNNNWSNQTSAARGGFDAEIVDSPIFAGISGRARSSNRITAHPSPT